MAQSSFGRRKPYERWITPLSTSAAHIQYSELPSTPFQIRTVHSPDRTLSIARLYTNELKTIQPTSRDPGRQMDKESASNQEGAMANGSASSVCYVCRGFGEEGHPRAQILPTFYESGKHSTYIYAHYPTLVSLSESALSLQHVVDDDFDLLVWKARNDCVRENDATITHVDIVLPRNVCLDTREASCLELIIPLLCCKTRAMRRSFLKFQSRLPIHQVAENEADLDCIWARCLQEQQSSVRFEKFSEYWIRTHAGFLWQA